MQIVKVLYESDEIKDYITSLFQTNEFKNAMRDHNSYVYSLVDSFSKLPRIFIKTTDEKEWGHFYSWMNMLVVREYDNSAVNDLYYVHEIKHIATMLWKPKLGFYSWFKKMHENEFWSALTSEVFIHFRLESEMRSIRTKAFNHEIWADRFLKNYFDYNIKWGKKDEEIFQEIIAQRWGIIYGMTLNQEDFIELQISRYAQQNFEWAKVWKEKYNIIETALYNWFHMLKIMDPRDATNRYLDIIEEHSTNNIPFETEADAFNLIYKTFNTRFGNLRLQTFGNLQEK